MNSKPTVKRLMKAMFKGLQKIIIRQMTVKNIKAIQKKDTLDYKTTVITSERVETSTTPNSMY